ncbi:AFG1-like ATPase-domain-containing protein [Plectosphaerella plurivora]|uniref:AFG1-like ATPase-domain-containing protein n=1 Tax=Plectosphaerella plurivora TaxID=936078 RepID=A0A9P8VH82_9PEZI|nr:AFG1-like ATPase-domain-containing protein [Plectosphaerella plurivora]
MFTLAIVSTLIATGLAETIHIDVGRVPLTFSPEVVHASIGDVLEFRFYPQAHSVVQGDFDKPCAPVDHGGFFSGFVPVPVGSISDQVFKVTVEHEEPMFIYCSQGSGNHCPRGMVAAINPSGNQTLSAYAQNAIGRAIFSPFPDEPFGGVFGPPSLVGEPEDGETGGDKSDDTCPPDSLPSSSAGYGGARVLKMTPNPGTKSRDRHNPVSARCPSPTCPWPYSSLNAPDGRRFASTVKQRGPLAEYDRRVEAGTLRNDEHQRGIIESLEALHHELAQYRAPAVVHPTLESLQPKKSLLGSWFGGGGKPGQAKLAAIPSNLPRGLYLFGDVGSGKTMLMDLFYDTLPSSVRSKTRIHFHNFMQDVHKRLHKMKVEHGSDIDAVPFVAADIAQQGNVLCFDEFQCTDVADAMILRRLLEALMSHGVVLVTTSNRHPDDLYKNGIQRESFIPAIKLLKNRLHVINLDSPTDYRKIPRPPSGVYHTPLDAHARSHAEKWFRFLGDPEGGEPHSETQRVWGREIFVPRVSGTCAWFTFDELIGRPTSAADFLELVRSYDAFIITEVPGMTFRQRDLARRFITFIDAVYESHAKLVLTTEKPLTELFVSRAEIEESLGAKVDADDTMSHLMEDLDHNIDQIKGSGLFSGDEEAFAFARALSRLSHMGSKEWVERGMGLEEQGGKQEKDNWTKVRSKQMEDSM